MMKTLIIIVLFLSSLNSWSQQVAIADIYQPQVVSALDFHQSNIYCLMDGDLLEVRTYEEECREAVVFGHSLCFEGDSESVASAINDDRYHFEGFAYFSTAMAMDEDHVHFQLNIRRSFRALTLPSCRQLLED